jgi:hypothetical protein
MPGEVTIVESPEVVQNAERKMSFPVGATVGKDKAKTSRRRRSSSLMYQEPPESLEQQSDQAILPNLNSQWVNAKGMSSRCRDMARRELEQELLADCERVVTGAWLIHFILILLLKIVYDIIPSISQETSWTLTNTTYMFATYLMFHYVRGIPFEFNAGAYDNLNMWEQIDNEDQYTPAKKFLLAVPICLFLVSTHYTHYDLSLFVVNFLATVAVVVPKLPAVRFFVKHRFQQGSLILIIIHSFTECGSPSSTRS